MTACLLGLVEHSIAALHGTGSRRHRERRLREKAGELCCDALMIEGASEHQSGASGLDPQDEKILGNCLVYSMRARAL